MNQRIEHKDGSTVKQSFAYTYDDAYNITKIVHEDGSQWDYEYDDRYHLASADRSNAASPNNTIVAEYT